MHEVMIAEDYDYTKKLKLFIRFFHLFDCSNQMSTTSVRYKIFWFCKKYFEADAVEIMIESKSQKRHMTGFETLCHNL